MRAATTSQDEVDEVGARVGNFRVRLIYLADGEGGGYDATNADDLACLRFFAERLDKENGVATWSRLGDAATLIPASTGRARRRALAALIASRLDVALQRGDVALRAELEQLAWITPDWLETAA